MVDCRFRIAFSRRFEFPRVSAFVVEKAGIVVAFVEVFEDGGEDFGEFFWEVDSFGG